MEIAFLKLQSIQSDKLRPVSNAYQNSLKNIISLSRLPAVTMRCGIEVGLGFSNTLHHLRGNAVYTILDVSEAMDDEHTAALASKMIADAGRVMSLERYMQEIAVGATVFSGFAASEAGETAQAALLKVHEAAIISSWAAFESLLGEVWCTVVDHAPASVKTNVWEKIVRPKLDKTDGAPSIAAVIESGVNPSEKLGTFLSEIECVSFLKWSRIEKLYKDTFGNVGSTVFDTARFPALKVLNAYRNAISHNAGVADSKFVDQVSHSPEFRKIIAGSPLILTGDQVKILTTSAAVAGSELVAFADLVLVTGNIPEQWPSAM